MKTSKNLSLALTRATFLVAFAGLAFLSPTLAAQEKGAERLTKLQRLSTVTDVQRVESGDTVVMSCPKCKDSWAKVVQPGSKRGNKETAVVQRHECPGCETKIVTLGVGKAAKDVVKHVCKHCGSDEAYCCVLKKGGSTAGNKEEHKGHQH